MTADGLTTDRRILFVLTQSAGRRARFEPANTADGSTTDRQILFIFTYPSGRRAPFRASDSGWVNEGQTNSVCFDTICLAVERRSEHFRASDLTLVGVPTSSSLACHSEVLPYNSTMVLPIRLQPKSNTTSINVYVYASFSSNTLLCSLHLFIVLSSS